MQVQISAVTASLVLLAVACVVWTGSYSRPVILLGADQVFDSNTPVQWDSSAVRTDIGNLHRYFKSAGADLSKLPEARTFELAEEPQGSQHGVQMWSKSHRANVAVGKVDKSSVKGIWHSKDEAWAGIDDILPTDTPYAYEEDHEDRGETAKMKSFIDHVQNELSMLEKQLPTKAMDSKQKAQVSSLMRVLEAGKSALANIEQRVRGDVMHSAMAVPQLSQVKHQHQQQSRVGLRAHYVSAKSARNDIDSYFDNMDQMTKRENEDNARASGHVKEPLPLHKLSAVKTNQMQVHIDSDVARAFAKEFASQMSAALASSGAEAVNPAGESESCKLCVKIFGCMDCCEPVCKSAPAPAPSPDKTVKEDKANTGKQEAAALSKQLVLAGHEAAQELSKIEKQLSSIADAASSAKAKTASQQAAAASHSAASLSRMPCECKSNDCKECPDSDEAVRAAYKKHLKDEKKTLAEAEKAVAISNDILQERIAALHATNQMAIRQGLGAYGPESSEEVWPAREPTPGKSEQIGSGVSDVIKQLVQKVGSLQARTNSLKMQVYEAERAATHGAEVTAQQRHLISELEAQLQEQHRTARTLHHTYVAAGLARYGGPAVEQLATETILPFYEQPGYGGPDSVMSAVRFFKHHPHQMKRDIGPHPILSQD